MRLSRTRKSIWTARNTSGRNENWNAPGNIKDFVTRLNRIRHENRALQVFRNLRFHWAENDQVLFFFKITEARDNVILVVVSLDPYHAPSTFSTRLSELIDCLADETYQVHDLLTDERYLWSGSRNFVALNPDKPTHVFRVRKVRRETDFETYL